MNEIAKCELCGEPMPQGEEMFKFHGYSGTCPKPPMVKQVCKTKWETQQEEIESLRQQTKDARRTAEYWKAEHLAGNEQLADSKKQVTLLRDALERQVAHDKYVSYERCPDCDYPQKCSREAGCLVIKDHSPIAKKALAATEPKEQGK